MDKYFIGYVKEDDGSTKEIKNQGSVDDRFPQRYDSGWPNNVLGYGANNPWIPPLERPTTLLGWIDRHLVVLLTCPLMYFFTNTLWIMLANTYNGDFLDGYWYNNAQTVGYQLYPQGIYKYFDVSSVDGYWNFSLEWTWLFFTTLMSPLTLFIPLNLWIVMFSEQATWDTMDRFF